MKVLGRFKKLYPDREVQMIEEEERYHEKLLCLLQITKFIMKRCKAFLSSLNLKYKALYKGDNN